MAYKLKNLKIVKVDFVVEGANPDANIALHKGKDGDAAPEGMKKDAATFTESLSLRYLDKIADDMWNLCFALNDSLCSILYDPAMDAAGKAAAMRESVSEFQSTIEGAITNWTAGKPAGILMKFDGESQPGDADETLVKALAKMYQRYVSTVFATEEPVPNESKGEGPTMRIDKSKLTPEEAAALEAIEKKAGIPEEAPGEAPTASADGAGQEPTPTAKSAPAAPVANPAPVPAADGEDIYKGLPPQLRQEIETLRKFRQDTEDAKLREIAGGYTLIGKTADDLFPVLKSLKATSQEAYDAMISTLDGAKAAVEKSGVFAEIGKSGNGSMTRGGAVKEAEGKAVELMKSRTDLNFAQAVDAVLLADPELAQRYETEDE